MSSKISLCCVVVEKTKNTCLWLFACDNSRSFSFVSVGSYPCRVISGSVNGVTAQSFVILVMLKTPYAETFHLVRFKGIGLQLTVKSNC